MKKPPPGNPFALDGRIILVTGAGGRLGRAIATGLAAAGARLIVAGRRIEPLHELSRALTDATGAAPYCITFDVGNPAECARAVAEISAKFDRLDALVNNAYSGRAATIDNARVEDFQASFNEAIIGPFELIRQARPLLERAASLNKLGGASIVNIGSMYGTVSPDPRIYGHSGANNPPYYGAAKAGLLQMTRYLACHLAPFGIRANCVSPGPFPAAAATAEAAAFLSRLQEKVPLGRIGQPAEISGPVTFLCSDAASYVTGAHLAVDGGWTAW